MRSLCTRVFIVSRSSFTPLSRTLWLPSGMPWLASSSSAGAHFGGQLARVIDVDAHPERMIFLQHLAELGRDPLRQENRDAGADAEELDVRDRAQAAEDFFQLVVAEEQRVAAGKQHVAHFGVFFEIFEGGFKLGVQFLFAHAADDAGAGAIAAVARATIGHEKQHAIRIAMDEPGHRHVRVFAARVRHVVGRGPGFLDPRDDLPPDRAVRIVAFDQVEKMRRDRERELVAGEQNAGALFFGEDEMLLELRQGGDAIPELPFPVVPEFRRDIREVTGRGGDELFSVVFTLDKSNHFACWEKS